MDYALKVVTSVTKTGGALTDYLTGCTKVAAGLDFSAALESTGLVDTWGNQLSGRLGNGATAAGSRKFASRVKTSASVDLSGICDIALGKVFRAGICRSVRESVGLGKQRQRQSRHRQHHCPILRDEAQAQRHHRSGRCLGQ